MGRPCQPRPDGPSMRMHAAALGVIPKLEPETRVAGSLIAKVWTDERPTEPGEYWLSFHPDNRNRFRSMPAVVAASVIERKDSLYALWGDVIRTPQVMLDLNDSRLLDGALWSVRETPADPFAKQETMRTEVMSP